MSTVRDAALIALAMLVTLYVLSKWGDVVLFTIDLGGAS